MSLLKKIRSGKNNKFIYYFRNYLIYYIIPNRYYRARLKSKLKLIRSIEDFDFWKRVNYYCKLNHDKDQGKDTLTLGEHKHHKRNVYLFDSYEFTKWFDYNLKWIYYFGDITFIPEYPAIVKSRPIKGENENSVLMKLNKIRHFIFIKDRILFENKKPMAIFRGKINGKRHRISFFEQYFEHPLCNLGNTEKKGTTPQKWKTKEITISEHLGYKFILTLEGNDVASNLKWVMSSNSIAIMPRPKYETWFMEGTLIPNYHYIEIKDDYSDLEEKIKYYSTHLDEALAIISNANEYVLKFRNLKRERLLSIAVLYQYLRYTNPGFD